MRFRLCILPVRKGSGFRILPVRKGSGSCILPVRKSSCSCILPVRKGPSSPLCSVWDDVSIVVHCWHKHLFEVQFMLLKAQFQTRLERTNVIPANAGIFTSSCVVTYMNLHKLLRINYDGTSTNR